MRRRLAGIALVQLVVWGSHALLYEEYIFADISDALPYRLAQLVQCLGLLALAARPRPERVLQTGALLLTAGLVPAHGWALLRVTDVCFVPMLLTMEWGQIVIALAALLSYRRTVTLFAVAWAVGVGVVVTRMGFDPDLSDHIVLLLIYAVVAVSVREHERSRVAELAARLELGRANEALLEADAARNRLFLNLGHDVRTPLALVRGEARLLQDRLTDPEGREALSRIDRSAANLAELADQLIELARLDAGRLDVEPEAVDVRQAVGLAVAQFAGGARAGRVLLTPDDGASAAIARVDRRQLGRILSNLLDNASRQLARGATYVRAAVRAEGEVVVVEVENDGPGLPPDRRDRVFERFASFDVAGSVTSGIGLPVARELAEQNDGSLALVAPDGPVIFRLTLPRSDETPSTSAGAGVVLEAGPTVPPVMGRRRVLVVEDHADLRGFLARLLGAVYDVRAAADVRQAREALDAERVDVVVTDLMLPDGSGQDVLRAATARPGLPVVVVSAISDEGERVRLLAAGAADYVVKPFAAPELLARVQAAERRARETGEALERQREEFVADLHDGVSSSLARAALLLSSAERRALGDADAGEIVSRARRAVLEALEEARALVLIRAEGTASVEDVLADLTAAAEHLVGGFGARLRCRQGSDGTVSALSAAEVHVARRVVVEAVTNALKHAPGASLSCDVRVERGRLRVAVANDAARSAPDALRTAGVGLRGLARRVERLGGRFEAGPGPGLGWVVEAELPLALSRVRPAA